jgi:hypothetical protein
LTVPGLLSLSHPSREAKIPKVGMMVFGMPPRRSPLRVIGLAIFAKSMSYHQHRGPPTVNLFDPQSPGVLLRQSRNRPFQ